MAFSGIIYFTDNGAKKSGYSTTGGGVYMELKSTFSILPNTTVYWESNHATLGGAIYIHDGSSMSYCTPFAKFVPQEKCFFQLPVQNLSNGINAGPAATVRPVRPWPYRFLEGEKWRRLDSNLACVIECPLQALRRSLRRLRGL